MKKYIILFMFSFVLSDCSLCDAAWSDDPNYRGFVTLPKSPPDASIVLFGPLPKGIMGKSGEENPDWKPLLEKMGVSFPDGGFAIFFIKARVLAVATHGEGLEMIKVILE